MSNKRKLQSVSNSKSVNKKARLDFDDAISLDPQTTTDQQNTLPKTKPKKEKISVTANHVAAHSSDESKHTVIKKKKSQSALSPVGKNKTVKSKKPRKAASSEQKEQQGKSRKLPSKGKQRNNLLEPNAFTVKKSNKKTEVQLSDDKRTKKRKHVSSDEELSYASHFSSDSDESLEQPAHSDRATQREWRRARAERLQRTLFVGNLPPQVSRKRLKQLFNKVLRSDAKCLKVDCHVESVRFRGVVPSTGGLGKLARKRAVVQGEMSAGVSENLLAYVVLSSKLGIRTALTLNGHWLQSEASATQSTTEDVEEDKGITTAGRFIRVDTASKRMSTIKPKYCVFLGNLAFDVQEDEVRDALSRFGEITNVRLIRDRETGAVKGIGYVQFEDTAAVSLAIRSSQSISIRDRPVRMEECKPIGQESTPSVGKRASWKPKMTTTKMIKSAKSHPNSVTKTALGPSKLHRKLDQTGRAKGITLPSNLRGSMRERYLAKRLAKKRKRQIRRQRHEEQQAQASALAEELKAKQKALSLVKRRKARKEKKSKKTTKKTKPKQKA